MKPLRLILVLLLLLAARCANLGLLYLASTREAGQSARVACDHLGLAGKKKTGARLAELGRDRPGIVTAVSSFDFFQSAVFRVNNPGEESFFDFGWGAVWIEHGHSTIAYSPSGMLRVSDARWGVRSKATASFLLDFLVFRVATGAAAIPGKGETINFVLRPPEQGRYLWLPQFIYFFLPLAAIVLAAIFFGRKVLSALLYYPVLVLLFEPRRALLTVPWRWLFQLTGGEPAGSLATPLAFVLLTLLSAAGLFFLVRRSRLTDKDWWPWFLLFFLLLPLFLRI